MYSIGITRNLRLAIAKRKFRVMPIEYMLRHRFESIKYAPALKAPTYVLRAAFDDVVPHSHTDQLVAKLAQLCGDDIVPESDHMNIPYLEDTQSRIANFLTDQFSKSLSEAAAAGSPAAGQVQAQIQAQVQVEAQVQAIAAAAGVIPAPAIAAAAIDAAPVLLPPPGAAIPAPALAAAAAVADAAPIAVPGLGALSLAPKADLPLSGK
jgi:hypothetical protein